MGGSPILNVCLTTFLSLLQADFVLKPFHFRQLKIHILVWDGNTWLILPIALQSANLTVIQYKYKAGNGNHSGELTVMKALAEVPLFPGTVQMDGVIYKVKMKREYHCPGCCTIDIQRKATLSAQMMRMKVKSPSN